MKFSNPFIDPFASLFPNPFKAKVIKRPKRILMIVKSRTLPHYNQVGVYVSSGLSNSVLFATDMLNKLGYITEKTEVIDNNCIDKVVTAFKPDIVIIEALWVVPEKFDVLSKLHPNVKWVIRLHSETPFLALEGNAVNWLGEYAKRNILIATNSSRMVDSLSCIVPVHKILYLPNYYPVPTKILKHKPSKNGTINIACFGAIRPLKNHLIQAIAAIKFANKKNLVLHFHVNSNRCEDNGDPVLSNLRSLFLLQEKHQLHEQGWLSHEDFIQLMVTMDISMQCSFSETYNIVTCDAVVNNIPVVVSSEVSWASSLFTTSMVDVNDMVKILHRAWKSSTLGVQKLNLNGLNTMNNDVKKQWTKVIDSL